MRFKIFDANDYCLSLFGVIIIKWYVLLGVYLFLGVIIIKWYVLVGVYLFLVWLLSKVICSRWWLIIWNFYFGFIWRFWRKWLLSLVAAESDVLQVFAVAISSPTMLEGNQQIVRKKRKKKKLILSKVLQLL